MFKVAVWIALFKFNLNAVTLPKVILVKQMEKSGEYPKVPKAPIHCPTLFAIHSIPFPHIFIQKEDRENRDMGTDSSKLSEGKPIGSPTLSSW